MANPQPLIKRTIIKKKTNKIKRWQHQRFKRVSESWRAPRGIDGRFRRRFKGTGPQPNIGYGSNKKTKHMLSNGFYQFRVKNVKELELLLMHNRRYCAQIAHGVGSEKRKQILQRAEELNIRVINGKADLQQEEE